MSTGQKHLIKCRCILPQFRNVPVPPSHQFIVFSVIDDTDLVVPKFAQCNNCGIIHKVTELSRSELVGREAMSSLMTIDDVKTSLPPSLITILEGASADLPTYEAAKFIIENQRWGDFVALTSEVEDNVRQGKYVRVLGANLFKVDSYIRDEVIK